MNWILGIFDIAWVQFRNTSKRTHLGGALPEILAQEPWRPRGPGNNATSLDDISPPSMQKHLSLCSKPLCPDEKSIGFLMGTFRLRPFPKDVKPDHDYGSQMV